MQQIPRKLRGIYVLYKYSRRTDSYNVVYVGMAGGSIRRRLNRHKVKKAGLWTHFADIRVLMTLVGGKIKFTESKFAESKNLPQVEYRGKFKR